MLSGQVELATGLIELSGQIDMLTNLGKLAALKAKSDAM